MPTTTTWNPREVPATAPDFLVPVTRWYDASAKARRPNIRDTSRGTGPWTWLELRSDDVVMALEILDPAILLLTLAGYEVTQVAIDIDETLENPLLVDMVGYRVKLAGARWEQSVSSRYPGKAAAVALWVVPRTRFGTRTGPSQAIALDGILETGVDGGPLLTLGLDVADGLNTFFASLAEEVKSVRTRLVARMAHVLQEGRGPRGLFPIYVPGRWRFGGMSAALPSAEQQRLLFLLGERLYRSISSYKIFFERESEPTLRWRPNSSAPWSPEGFLLPTWFEGLGELKKETLEEHRRGDPTEHEWETFLGEHKVKLPEDPTWNDQLTGLIQWFEAHLKHMPAGWTVRQYIERYLVSWNPTTIPGVSELKRDELAQQWDLEHHDDLNTDWEGFLSVEGRHVIFPNDESRDCFLLWLSYHLSRIPKGGTVGAYVDAMIKSGVIDVTRPNTDKGRRRAVEVYSLFKFVKDIGLESWLHDSGNAPDFDQSFGDLSDAEVSLLLEPWVRPPFDFIPKDLPWKTYTRMLLAAHERKFIDVLSAPDIDVVARTKEILADPARNLSDDDFFALTTLLKQKATSDEEEANDLCLGAAMRMVEEKSWPSGPERAVARFWIRTALLYAIRDKYPSGGDGWTEDQFLAQAGALAATYIALLDVALERSTANGEDESWEDEVLATVDKALQEFLWIPRAWDNLQVTLIGLFYNHIDQHVRIRAACLAARWWDTHRQNTLGRMVHLGPAVYSALCDVARRAEEGSPKLDELRGYLENLLYFWMCKKTKLHRLNMDDLQTRTISALTNTESTLARELRDSTPGSKLRQLFDVLRAFVKYNAPDTDEIWRANIDYYALLVNMVELMGHPDNADVVNRATKGALDQVLKEEGFTQGTSGALVEHLTVVQSEAFRDFLGALAPEFRARRASAEMNLLTICEPKRADEFRNMILGILMTLEDSQTLALSRTREQVAAAIDSTLTLFGLNPVTVADLTEKLRDWALSGTGVLDKILAENDAWQSSVGKVPGVVGLFETALSCYLSATALEEVNWSDADFQKQVKNIRASLSALKDTIALLKEARSAHGLALSTLNGIGFDGFAFLMSYKEGAFQVILDPAKVGENTKVWRTLRETFNDVTTDRIVKIQKALFRAEVVASALCIVLDIMLLALEIIDTIGVFRREESDLRKAVAVTKVVVSAINLAVAFHGLLLFFGAVTGPVGWGVSLGVFVIGIAVQGLSWLLDFQELEAFHATLSNSKPCIRYGNQLSLTRDFDFPVVMSLEVPYYAIGWPDDFGWTYGPARRGLLARAMDADGVKRYCTFEFAFPCFIRAFYDGLVTGTSRLCIWIALRSRLFAPRGGVVRYNSVLKSLPANVEAGQVLATVGGVSIFAPAAGMAVGRLAEEGKLVEQGALLVSLVFPYPTDDDVRMHFFDSEAEAIAATPQLDGYRS